jgi:hypothetical protein
MVKGEKCSYYSRLIRAMAKQQTQFTSPERYSHLVVHHRKIQEIEFGLGRNRVARQTSWKEGCRNQAVG